MMTALRRLELPIRLVESQTRDVIATGGGILSAEVLSQWSARSIWTGAGRRVDVAELTDVSRGGLREPSRLNPLVVSFIAQFLNEDRSSMALFEDAVARASD